MRRITAISLWLLCLWVPFHAYGVAVVMDVPKPVAMVEKLHTALLDNMKEGKRLGFEGRRERLAPVVLETFDLTAMTRVAVGASWQKMPEKERKDLVDAFTVWTTANYASQFKDFAGEEFVTTGHTDPKKGDVVVMTEIRPKGKTPTILNYRLRQETSDTGDGPWQVIDIYLDGAVSQLALRRSDFAAALAKGGASALMQHMKDLTAKLAAEG